MKQKDIAMIVLIIGISGLISFFVSRLVFSGPGQRNQQYEVVDTISADFPVPSNTYFNDQSVNPTQLITIGGNSNTSNLFTGQ